MTLVLPQGRSGPAPRSLCVVGAIGLHLALGGLFLWQGWDRAPVVEASTPVVVDVMLGAPPQPVSEAQSAASDPALAEPSKAEVQRPSPPQPVPQPVPQPMPLPVAEPVLKPLEVARPSRPVARSRPVALPTAPAVEMQTAAPSARPSASVPSAPPTPQAPPAPRASRTSAMSWEAQVMAQLERHRRYPVSAQRRGLEGVARIRIRMDRQGLVLASRLERSSGHPELDRAAMETPRRAQPLPAIPAHLPDQVERVVDIDFYL